MESAGIEYVAGDMFESIPKGDAIFVKVSLDKPTTSYCFSRIAE